MFSDYVWKNGVPRGTHPSKENAEEAYKIVSDPYQKHFSIEKYMQGQFHCVVYDSLLLDFRHLKIAEQRAWQKIPFKKDASIIRNQDDRALYMETYIFEKQRCRECRVSSVHGIPLSVHKMFYTALGDAFNGVILYDANAHVVMTKHYSVDVETGEFQELLNEDWNIELS